MVNKKKSVYFIDNLKFLFQRWPIGRGRSDIGDRWTTTRFEYLS